MDEGDKMYKDENRKSIARGTDPQDEKFFSLDAVSRLCYAQEEVRFLLDRGYPMKPIIKLIGDHYQLSTRQRLALMRGTCSTQSEATRKAKCLRLEQIKGQTIFIDGFNLMISLEVALSGSILIKGQDGLIRDLAGLRGTYKLIDKTGQAIKLIGQVLDKLQVEEAYFYLDAPVSNSGRLKMSILEESIAWKTKVQVEVVHNPDTLLSKKGHVVTGDAIILDQCKSYFNLLPYIIEQHIPKSWIIYLDK